MSIYINILRIIGLIDVFYDDSSNIDINTNTSGVIIDIENGSSVTIKNNIDNIPFWKKYYKNIISFSYFAIISAFILWPCIYSIYKAAESANVRYFTSNIFKFLLFVQYILGIIYYRGKHFRKHLMALKLLNSNIVKLAIILNLVAALAIAGTTIGLLTTDINMNIYSDLYMDKSTIAQIFICIIIFITQFYGYSIFIANTIIFAATFINHSKDVHKYVKKLKKFISIKDITIIDIITDLDTLKTNYKKSVIGMNNLFTSILVIGFLSIYFVIINYGTQVDNIFSYIEVALLLLNIFSYILPISKVNNNVEDITGIVNSMEFNAVFLNREPFTEMSGDIFRPNKDELNKSSDINNLRILIEQSNNNQESISETLIFIKDITLRSMIRDLENSNSNDWQILSNKLAQPWKYFQILGFAIYDYTILSQLLGMGLLFYGALGLGAKFGFNL